MKTLAHVWRMICQNKVFYGIYIFGSAIAIATVTVLAVIYWNQVAPVYPEYNRSRTAYFDHISVQSTDGSMSMGGLSYEAVHDYFGNLKNAEKTSVACYANGSFYIQPETGEPDFKVSAKCTDCEYFEIYDFDFIAGKPFDRATFDSGLPVVILTAPTARKAFGATEPEELIGRRVSINFKDYEVCGIVRPSTPMEKFSFADFYMPYTAYENYKDDLNDMPFTGSYEMIFLTDNRKGLMDETKDILDRYNNSQEEFTIEHTTGINDQITYALGDEGWSEDFTLSGFIFKSLGILFVLMLVPAMNLSGMISGRMEGRLAEMGVRKSFGASRGILLRQVLWENLLLTVGGGMLGFLLAYIMLKLGIGTLIVDIDAESSMKVTEEMMFSPIIFLFVFFCCAVLNTMSALIPAYRSLGHPIVESLKEK